MPFIGAPMTHATTVSRGIQSHRWLSVATSVNSPVAHAWLTRDEMPHHFELDTVGGRVDRRQRTHPRQGLLRHLRRSDLRPLSARSLPRDLWRRILTSRTLAGGSGIHVTRTGC